MFLLNLLQMFQESKATAALSLYPRRHTRGMTCFQHAGTARSSWSLLISVPRRTPKSNPCLLTRYFWSMAFVNHVNHQPNLGATHDFEVRWSCIYQFCCVIMTIKRHEIYPVVIPCQLSSHWWRVPRLLWPQTWYCPASFQQERSRSHWCFSAVAATSCRSHIRE